MSDKVEVTRLPQCDLCAAEGDANVAEYDAKTDFGPWANMCAAHFEVHGVGLGTGRGQRLILKEEPR